MLGDYEYSKFKENAEELAERVIRILEEDDTLSFPIDPFYLLNRFGIKYKLMDFDELEGIYIAPLDETDYGIVGINKNRPIQRQRFTAAHEICHHIKDRNQQAILCPIDGRKNDIEKFADSFASELLMPRKYFNAKVSEYINNGFISFDDALKISIYFGVSFQSCVYTLAYRCKLIEGDIDSKILKRRIDNYKPMRRMKELGLDPNRLGLKYQLIDYYSFIDNVSDDIKWYRFKNHYIANEERLEGSKLEDDFMFEIITDLRLKKRESEYCSSEYQSVIEVAGQIEMFDYIFKEKITEGSFPLKELHKKLYSYSLHPEYGGTYRNTNNIVNKSNVETCDFLKVYGEMYNIDNEIFLLLENSENKSVSDFIKEVVKIHHNITVVHPFSDGNGRVSRSLLNWLLHQKGIYPIYVSIEKKCEYLSFLEIADTTGNLDSLIEFIIEEIINSDIILNNSIL